MAASVSFRATASDGSDEVHPKLFNTHFWPLITASSLAHFLTLMLFTDSGGEPLSVAKRFSMRVASHAAHGPELVAASPPPTNVRDHNAKSSDERPSSSGVSMDCANSDQGDEPRATIRTSLPTNRLISLTCVSGETITSRPEPNQSSRPVEIVFQAIGINFTRLKARERHGRFEGPSMGSQPHSQLIRVNCATVGQLLQKRRRMQ